MKICLDAGHYGKYNQSPCDKRYYESDMTWKLHIMLKEELIKKGFEIITTREKQAVDLGLETRGKKSKGCVLFLSIHSNASSNVYTDNSMACCLINDNKTNIDDISVELGKKIADRVTKIMTGKDNNGSIYRRSGNGGTDYYGVLRGAKSVGTPAILMEHGYHTNANNVRFLLNDDNLRKIAIAEADVIADYFNVSNTNNNTNTSDYLYRVKVLDDCLNIRKEPDINSKIVGTITNHSIYTIVDEKSNNGVIWGKLKSGVGWISTHSKYVKKI